MYLPDAGSLNQFPRLKALTREKKNAEKGHQCGKEKPGGHLDGLISYHTQGKTGTKLAGLQRLCRSVLGCSLASITVLGSQYLLSKYFLMNEKKVMTLSLSQN